MTAKRKRPKVRTATIHWDPSKVEAGVENRDGARAIKRHRPKVRYVAAKMEAARGEYDFAIYRRGVDRDDEINSAVSLYATPKDARRIAAALNLYEAVRRGEV